MAYHCLQPDQLAGLLNIPTGSSAGGTRVAVIDSGFADHPYYTSRKLVVSTPAGQPRKDRHGHGTAIISNIFAVAPDADVHLYRQTSSPQDALEAAFDDGARILSCSWGWDYEQSFPILEATIRDLVDEGGIVLFAAGNGQHAWPSSMPEVLSIGGVFANEHGELEASSYASGFLSSLYPNPPRRVPDFCGLCGLAPRGVYLTMPCPPGCEMDRHFGGEPFPLGDETTRKDGWVVASGTSSATPQVAGIVALLQHAANERGRTLTATAAKATLEQSARTITQGKNVFGFPAVGHPSTACGWGLVDASKALATLAAQT